MNGVLYILQSTKTGKYYIGSTNDIERRFSQHKEGKSKYTRDSGPYELVFVQKFETLQTARKAEFWIKKQKDHNFIDRKIELLKKD